MQVVLTKTIEKIGVVGELKDVKPGFARNFLFPKKLAVLATDASAKSFRSEYKKASEMIAKQKTLINELADQWRGQTYKIVARASDDGTLYGSVGMKEIRKLLGRDDVEISVPTLKTVGNHSIDIVLADGSKVPVTVVIEAEGRAAERSKK